MMITEAIVEALKLMIEIVSIAWAEHQKQERVLADWAAKQAAFEKMVTQAMDVRRIAWSLENSQVQQVDDLIDSEIDAAQKKPKD